MKYSVGNLVLLKHCEYKPRYHLRLRLRLRPRLHLRLYHHLYPHLINTYGVITQIINHSDAWEGESTSDSNVYVWFSQLDGKEYYFCEDEVTGEVVE
jgi:hypothetical protein